ncbi:MAG: class II aldolase/adducin family protein [candidate division NC10 bacterium]|nr:class II aldolase/adducin family protein [candidate division NC10 bacterium]
MARVRQGRGAEARTAAAVAAYCRKAQARDLVGGSGGNMSARVPGTDRMLITPTGMALEEVTPARLVVVDIPSGRVLRVGRGLAPSEERATHLAVYRTRGAAGAVLHTHSPFATAYACAEPALPLVTITAEEMLHEVPLLEYAFPGSDALATIVARGIAKFPDRWAFLMCRHGVLAVGRDSRAAYLWADLLESTAKTSFLHALLARQGPVGPPGNLPV